MFICDNVASPYSCFWLGDPIEGATVASQQDRNRHVRGGAAHGSRRGRGHGGRGGGICDSRYGTGCRIVGRAVLEYISTIGAARPVLVAGGRTATGLVASGTNSGYPHRRWSNCRRTQPEHRESSVRAAQHQSECTWLGQSGC